MCSFSDQIQHRVNSTVNGTMSWSHIKELYELLSQSANLDARLPFFQCFS